MYEEYFGFSKKPFSIVPDPYYFYLSVGHAEALAHLLYGINSEGGFVLLTGDIGTGKTTACRRLLELLPAETEVAFILNPELTVVELLCSICREFRISLPAGPATNPMLVSRIHDYLLDVHARGRRAILILEEAQNLKPELLEQIRLLTNLETNEQKLLQMILIGQPELRDLLAQPEMLQLSQRITARYHLGPLSREETIRYIRHRLALAGYSQGRLFPAAILRQVHRLTRGVPRLINVICDRALLGAYVQGLDRIDRKTLKQAAREVLGREGPWRRWSSVYQTGVAFLLLFLAALGTGVLLYWYGPWPEPLPAPATASRPAEANSRKVAKSVLVWPGALSAEQTRRSAHRVLLALWHMEDKAGELCGQADAQGLRCLQGRDSLASLRLMNKPAVLILADEKKGPYYVTLTALQGKAATVAVGSETRVVDLDEINRNWSGEYLLLWRVPPAYRGKLQEGDRGPMVIWLKKHLALAQGRTLPAEADALFDRDCLREVKKFQLAAGLVPDGIVGTRTIVPLSALTGSGDPVLHSGKGFF
jgi:general secretion pathway protein A